MTHAQRLWLAASLVIVAVALSAVALEWDARPSRDPGFGVLVVSRTGEDAAAATPALDGTVGGGQQRGLFVRREWGPIAAVWGGGGAARDGGRCGVRAAGGERAPGRRPGPGRTRTCNQAVMSGQL